VTPTRVLALRPAVCGYRLAWAREWLHDTFRPASALRMRSPLDLGAGADW